MPFDEGSLTGTLTADATLARRRLPQHLFPARESVATRSSASARLQPLVPDGMSLPELALRHILQTPAVSTVIPGMRKLRHVEANLAGQRRPSRSARHASWLSSGRTGGTAG